MPWQDHVHGDPLAWLTESGSPGVRYLALRDLCAAPAAQLEEARRMAHEQGPIATVLEAMDPEGYWVQPGAGYGAKYRSTTWSIILLAQLGASAEMDERIARACAYLLDHALLPGGQFTASGGPSGTVDCLQGNLAWALLELGWDDPRLERSFDWMARTVTGEGIAPASDRTATVRYYAGKCGPGFACGANNRLPCAWGAVKVLMALAKWPADRHTPQVKAAIQQGIEFFLNSDPAEANYPSGYSDKPSSNWWKFGFPLFYITDLLQVAEALAALGCGRDPRLANLVSLILSKQDEQGRWPLEYDYAGKTWVDFGPKKQPNPWVTLRALRVLKAVL